MHTAVMQEEALEYLSLKPGHIIVDCTIGAAGHSKKILEKIIPGGKLIGIDLDKDILEIAKKELESFESSFFLRQADFRQFDRVLKDLRIDKVDGLLFDLGVSSYQLALPERGFSFNLDGPLDMRMARVDTIKTASWLVNSLSKEELADIIFNLGEERYSRRIAERIVKERRVMPIQTTGRLKQIVLSAAPKSKKWQKIHPATRTFQALRIAVNDELSALKEALNKAPEALKPQGRVCVISFHSLEDRIVKNIFRDMDKKNILKVLTKKPVCPGQEEVNKNPRARSAKLRAALKT